MCSVEKDAALFSDPFLRRLEERHIVSYLKPSFRLLHIGCSDMTQLCTYAPLVQSLTVLESDGDYIAEADKEAKARKIGNLTFVRGDVENIPPEMKQGDFDCIISPQRLTALQGWESQERALGRLHSLLGAEGLLIISECFHDELEYLNKFRGKLGLSTFQGNGISMPLLRPLLHGEFDIWALKNFIIESLHDYGVYFFLTCIVQPLSSADQKSQPDNALNEVALKLGAVTQKPVFREISALLCYVLRKK
jgi:hypothetical protein